MSGHGQKLSRKQEAAIAALLELPTCAAAAKAAGISEATMRRWQQQDEFKAAYRDARRQLVEGAVGRLQGVTGEAVETLRRNLTCSTSSVEVAAAKFVLEHASKAIELLDLAERIEALEELVTGHGEKR